MATRHFEGALSEERLKVTLTSIADGVITTDDQGRVTRLNAIAEQLTGWASADAMGRPLPKCSSFSTSNHARPQRTLSTVFFAKGSSSV